MNSAIQKVLSIILSFVFLFSFVACAQRTEPDNTNLTYGICQIPKNEEALVNTANALRHYDESYLPDRKIETVGTFVAEDCAILVRKLVFSEGQDRIVVHVADVYIDNMSQFVGYVCRDENGNVTKAPGAEAVKDTNAVLLINCDFLTARKWGLYVRGGVNVRDKEVNGIDLLLIGKDGKMRIEDGDTFDKSTALRDKNLYHIFSFGPSLLNEDGSPRNEDSQFHITEQYSKWNNYESSVGFPVPNPRTAVGQASDGHFIFVTVDGRLKNHSRGATFPEMSHILYEEGAVTAYNMDGGGSEIMIFRGEELSRQYEDGRRIPTDYICITSSGYAAS